MLTSSCQRWRARRGIYRPVGEPINTRAYEVALIDVDGSRDDPTKPKGFVRAHHYSQSYPAARVRFGLYRSAELVGVAVFSVPFDRAVSDLPKGTLELGRFVLLDDVPSNGESWFLARCFAEVRQRAPAVVSFSDPVRRTDAEGKAVFAGHIGTVYQATNGSYLGLGVTRTKRLLPDGRVLADRGIQKIRKGERGWRSVARLLVELGAPEPSTDRLAWLHEWLPKLTRTFRHGGCHRYAWRFGRTPLPSLPYPKWSAC